MIENIENCKNCMKKLPQKIDLHQCNNLLEMLFGWRDITQNKLLKYGGGKFSLCISKQSDCEHKLAVISTHERGHYERTDTYLTRSLWT